MITSLPTERIFSNVAVANISKSFTHKMAAKAIWHRKYVTVTLYRNRNSDTAAASPIFGIGSSR